MNYNIISYIIYLPIISFIMIYIGWLFYSHGEIFLQNLFNNESLAKNINNLLLMGYYLVNLGYAIITISYWETIDSFPEMLNMLSNHLGIIIIGLALLHYNNVFWLNYLVNHKSLKL